MRRQRATVRKRDEVELGSVGIGSASGEPRRRDGRDGVPLAMARVPDDAGLLPRVAAVGAQAAGSISP
jgi:hypothetical protein